MAARHITNVTYAKSISISRSRCNYQATPLWYPKMWVKVRQSGEELRFPLARRVGRGESYDNVKFVLNEFNT